MIAVRRLAAVLAVDVVCYSRLMGEDEAGTAQTLLGQHKGILACNYLHDANAAVSRPLETVPSHLFIPC
jgi:class 3 adenylate cyclase